MLREVDVVGERVDAVKEPKIRASLEDKGRTLQGVENERLDVPFFLLPRRETSPLRQPDELFPSQHAPPPTSSPFFRGFPRRLHTVGTKSAACLCRATAPRRNEGRNRPCRGQPIRGSPSRSSFQTCPSARSRRRVAEQPCDIRPGAL